MNLGEFIKQKRLDKNMTLEQLGDKIGKPKNFIFRIESGNVKSLKNDTIQKLAEVLDVPVLDFFVGYDENGNKKDIDIECISKEQFKNEVLQLLDKMVVENETEKEFFIYSLNKLCDDDKE